MIFRNWVLENFPFLEDDFDALTDYELFCKMVEYMKESLDKVKAYQQQLNEFRSELDSYKNYFDNLDVQVEVDNKLDEMAESGELTDIIAQYLGLAGVLAFNTVSDMKSAENLVNGSICKTLGYIAIDDKGGSYYKVRNVTNEDVIDEGSLIALNNPSLVAVLLCDEIRPEMFGCHGDGETDDTTNFKKALNYAISKKLKFNGLNKYLINEKLDFYTSNYFNFYCKEIITEEELNPLINIADNFNNITIDKITGDDSGTAVRLSGIHGLGCSYNNIKINSISGFDIGLNLQGKGNLGTTYNNININYISATTNGILFDLELTTDFVNNNYINNTTIRSGICIKLDSIADANDFDGNVFNNIALENYSKGIYLENAMNNHFNNIRNLEVPQDALVVETDSLTHHNYFDFDTYNLQNKLNVLGYNNYFKNGLYDSANHKITDNDYIISNNNIIVNDNLSLQANQQYGGWNNNFDFNNSNIHFLSKDMVVFMGGDDGNNHTLKLNSILSKELMEFYLVYISSNDTTFNIVDENNVEIITATTLGKPANWKLVHVKYTAQNWSII